MADLSQPVPLWVILLSLGFIALCIIVGLAVIEYYKKKERD